MAKPVWMSKAGEFYENRCDAEAADDGEFKLWLETNPKIPLQKLLAVFPAVVVDEDGEEIELDDEEFYGNTRETCLMVLRKYWETL